MASVIVNVVVTVYWLLQTRAFILEVFQSKIKYRRGEKNKSELGKNKDKEEAMSRLMALGNM